MKNSKRGTAHNTNITTLFRSVRQSRGRIDLHALEDDLAEIEERHAPIPTLRLAREEQWESQPGLRRGRSRERFAA